MHKKKDFFEPVVDIAIHRELQSSFLDYAVSVVISRAIPDVRDGLKPVHRRVLYTMQQLGFFYNKPYHKSVRVVGDVLAKYHPHGDQAVYQTMVGMTQDFSRRYPLLDGQGNWGSIDGDNAAAMRYTEVRMQKICQEILADINRETVPFVPNFDESTVEPTVLPSKIPNLLINGTSGIAVGMATCIPPHNLSEIMDACIALVSNPNMPDLEILNYVKGPDLPTKGIICGRNGIIKAYTEGRGSIVVRGVIESEETEKGISLVITELPYQVVKSELVSKIAHLVKDKIIEGISNIRDESNKKGIRVVIELKRDTFPETIVNLLYKHTNLQNNINIMMIALLDNKPQIFTLKQALTSFIEHRKNIITKRTLFEREKAREAEHILAGLQKINDDIESAIKLISSSKNTEDAAISLKDKYSLSQAQIKAVLELRLSRLTSLERTNIINERAELIEKIKDLTVILENQEELKKEIIKEFNEIKDVYGDARKTIISDTASGDFDESAFVNDEEVVITLTKKGYIKRVIFTTYEIQHRGGKGKMGISSLDDSDDVVQDIFIAKNHDNLLFFTNFGRVYSKQVYEVPESSRTAKGRAIINILPLTEGEFVVKLLCARNLENLFLMMVTKKGVTKRTKASFFIDIRQTGIKAITLNENDELKFCILTSGRDSVILATKKGMGIRFLEKEVRVMGRQAAGVRGIRLKMDDEIVGARVVEELKDILFVTKNGFGKRVEEKDFRVAHRGGQGVKTIPTEGRNGIVVGLASVDDETDVILIDGNGKIIRITPQEIRTMGRQAQGVRLIRLDEGQFVACIAIIQGDEQAAARERMAKESENNQIEEQEVEFDEQVNEDEDLIEENEETNEKIENE
jgi:DNA gyrase subunit A